MSDTAIRVENLGKLYRIGTLQQRHDTLRDQITCMLIAPFHRLRKPNSRIRNQNSDHIWALKNVSFEVKRGEVVGIIGRNGAGKTTLLKILSRITEPTEGRAEVYGRVGSLLEVGTGFHPELTGRENIYLNGAILGMKRAEIDRKFNEIVAFAEIEKFMDTPVKHYSSGMYVRLAFAVAAHLEPEILLVDEVLAVGDAAFQKKCLGKMGDVAREGRTVLFVSHNMQAVARLCSRAILLDGGQVQKLGATPGVVSAYLYSGHNTSAEKLWDNLDIAPGDDMVRLTAVRAQTESGCVQETFDSRQPIILDVEYTVLKPVKNLAAELAVYNEDGTLLFASVDQYDEQWLSTRQPGPYRSRCWIPGNFLAEGSLFVRASIVEIQVPVRKHVAERDAIVFQIIDALGGDSARGQIAHSYPGIIRPKLQWETELRKVHMAGKP